MTWWGGSLLIKATSLSTRYDHKRFIFFLTFPSHLKNHRWLFSCYTPTAMGNIQGLSELLNRLIAIADSSKVLILMKVINIFKGSVHSNQSSPYHCDIYMPFFCRRIPCFRETKETSLVFCILCSMSLAIQKTDNIWRLKNWTSYCTEVSLQFHFLRVFFRYNTNCNSKAEHSFA